MTLTLTFEVKVMSRSHTPKEVLTVRYQTYNSITISHRPMIIVVTVRPRVGLITLALTFKVIPRSNAPNDSKVLGNTLEVLVDHAWVSPSSFVQLGYLAPNLQKCLQKIHFSSDFDHIWIVWSLRPQLKFTKKNFWPLSDNNGIS